MGAIHSEAFDEWESPVTYFCVRTSYFPELKIYLLKTVEIWLTRGTKGKVGGAYGYEVK